MDDDWMAEGAGGLCVVAGWASGRTGGVNCREEEEDNGE